MGGRDGGMLDFTFEIMDEDTINIRILYASEWFTFNIYQRDQAWTLHPFDGMLIQNKDMCRLVVSDLFKNKNFHVMCAKENIRLSELRTTINLEPEVETDPPVRTRDSRRSGEPSSDIQAYIDEHSLEDIIEIEKETIQSRVAFYKKILENMFMQGYGPADKEFIRIQAIVNIWTEAYNKLNGSSDTGSLGDKPKRW
ncbi:hypothetical protein D3C73_563100 [compost metagenome]